MSESKSGSERDSNLLQLPSHQNTAQTRSAISSLPSIYQLVVEKVYQAQIKDEKKRALAVETDRWRYDELPEKVEKRSKDEGLSKGELERLVEWKVTHGTFRPFLLPLIRKNTEESVRQATARARSILASTSTRAPETLRKALDAVCVLSGVGPATGTLLLSIFDPEDVPFFQDELFAWLVPDHKDKLKYNVKEYLLLLERAARMRKVLKDQGSGYRACELEKVGFLTGHRDQVPDNQEVLGLMESMVTGDHEAKYAVTADTITSKRKLPTKTTTAINNEKKLVGDSDVKSEADKEKPASKRQKTQHRKDPSQENVTQPTRRSQRNK